MASAKRSGVWLVGPQEEDILGAKLPSKRQVLAYFFHIHLNEKKNFKASARQVVHRVQEFWDRARIPTRQNYHSTEQVLKLHLKWKILQKNAKVPLESQREHERAFVDTLDDLFDIAHQDALQLIKIKEDADFLLAQRQKGRPGCMVSADRKLAEKEARTEKRKEVEKERIARYNSSLPMTGTVEGKCIDDDVKVPNFVVKAEIDEDFQEPSTSGIQKRPKLAQLLTKEVTATLDRTKVSSRAASRVLSTTAKSLGVSLDEVALSKSTIHRIRTQVRVDTAKEKKENFDGSGCRVVHWDGKLLPDLTGSDRVDRLPVIVTGVNDSGKFKKLLGVPKLAAGTGSEQANAVVEMLRAWKIDDVIIGMSFDTTSANTGQYSGACVLIESLLGRELFYFACRHHIFEVLLGEAFSVCLGRSTDPDIALFKSFKSKWQYLDHSQHATGIANIHVRTALHDEIDEILQFLLDQLTVHMPRDDYCELAELMIIFLGGVPPKGVHFLAPGAFHRARWIWWMAKAIYSLKIYMYREQFPLPLETEHGLRDICVFLVSVYSRTWFTAASSTAAARSDLTLCKKLIKFVDTNPKLSGAVLKKFTNHLWYLGEELVPLAFFDGGVSNETKRKMILALKEREGKSNSRKDMVRRVPTDLRDGQTLASAELEDFVSMKSVVFFERLRINTHFLNEDPSNWEADKYFQEAARVAESLQVTNDHAERGVALIQDYNKLLTKNETNTQYLLQVVEQHRLLYPDTLKETLKKDMI